VRGAEGNLCPYRDPRFFKITYTTFAGIAAAAHFLVLAWKPWF
jgi:hypothetical protein